MEAHNGLSARIVREAGFSGIWASGLSISAQFGVRDNNEASWTQVVDMLEFMADASDLPILLDGDTGYGNFNNMRRLVRKLEQRGIAGVCIEDKQFPEDQQLPERRAPAAGRHRGVRRQDRGRQGYADRPEFLHRRAGRGADRRLGHGGGAAARGGLSARRRGCHPDPQQAVEARRDPDLRARMGRPRAAGDRADASTTARRRDVFRKAGISTVIWANHLVRSAAAAMQSGGEGNPRQPDAGEHRGPHRRRSTRSSACRMPTSIRPPSGCICRRPATSRAARRAGGGPRHGASRR